MTAANLTPLEEVDYLEGVRRKRDELRLEEMQLQRRLGDVQDMRRQCEETLCARLPGPDLRRADR